MCKWNLPKQYAYVDPNAPPGKEFKRFENQIVSDAHLKACRGMLQHTDEYLSVYGWTGWSSGQINAEISKTALIDGIFLDFDDANDPQKAIRDAAEVAWYVGHCITNFSGAKGAHVRILCNPVDLIPDLKSSVLRGLANMLCDRLIELSTMDWSVIGDTSRVSRIIDSVHSKTKLHAIGLTAYELATCNIDEIREKAANRRGLIQVPEPSRWVSSQLWRIEEEIITERLTRMYDKKQISYTGYVGWLKRYGSNVLSERISVYNGIRALEDEWSRIRAKKSLDLAGYAQRGYVLGETAEETWLIKNIIQFKQTGRAATGSRKSEHKARVHLAKLADECGWSVSEICDIYTGADDYDPQITERMVRSCVGRR